jgi:hypothetical protein
MGIWPFNRQKKKKPEFLEIDVYFRNYEWNILRMDIAMDIAIIINQSPVHSWGIELPPGSWIAPSQYNRLPDTLKRYFEKTTLKVKTC